MVPLSLSPLTVTRSGVKFMSNKHICVHFTLQTFAACFLFCGLSWAFGKTWTVIKTTNLLSVLLVKQATQKSFQWACLLSANGGVLWFSAANYVPCAQQRGSLKHGSFNSCCETANSHIFWITECFRIAQKVKLHHRWVFQDEIFSCPSSLQPGCFQDALWGMHLDWLFGCVKMHHLRCFAPLLRMISNDLPAALTHRCNALLLFMLQVLLMRRGDTQNNTIKSEVWFTFLHAQ